MTEAPDPALCPLCGRPNACVRAQASAGREPGPCWCGKQRFPKELLAQVPGPAQRKACICADCLARAQGPDSETPPGSTP